MEPATIARSAPASTVHLLRLPVELPVGLEPALDTEQAAAFTGLAAATLEKLRSTGGGPRFVRYGRRAVRYLMADLRDFMASRTVASTSEVA